MGLLVAGLASGCGDDGGDTGSGGSGGSGSTTATTADTTTSTATTTTADTTTSTGTGGTEDDGNNSFDTAEDATIGEQVEGELDPPDTDVDFYKFEGAAGQVIGIFTNSKPDDDPYNDAYPDLVITLFDANQQQIAQNDDPFPRNTQDSQLYTILPADGTYYVKVEEYCEWQPDTCPPDYFDAISETAYAVLVAELDLTTDGVVVDTEPNDDGATATMMTYAPVDGQLGSYYLTLVVGDFASDTDQDWYSVHLPADIDLGGATEAVIQASTYPSGPEGNGSSSGVGLMTLIDPATGDIWAQADASTGSELSPPAMLDMDYFLTVEPPAGGSIGATPFYFINHNGTAFLNEPEAEAIDATGMNDTKDMAEGPLSENAQDDGSTSFFMQGRLPGGTDVDVFRIDLPSPGSQVLTIACGAQRSGSGLRGLKFTLLDASGNTISGGQSPSEDATTNLVLQDVDPGAADTVYVKIEAASQDTMVKSDFYRCGMNAHDPG
jgi:hypothetical protein